MSLIGAGLLYLILLSASVLIGGELSQIVIASLTPLPFALLAMLAYLAQDRGGFAWFASGVWLLVLIGGAGLIALTLVVGDALGIFSGAPGSTEPALRPGGEISMLIGVLGVSASLVGGALCLLPAVRRVVARVVPIDPGSYVHAVALACVVGVSMACVTPLLALQRPPLLDLVANMPAQEGATPTRSADGLLRDQIYTLIWTIPAALLAVGYGIRRGLADTLTRLGLVRPTLRQIGLAIGLALLLVGAVQGLGAGIDWLWPLMGWPQTDQEAFGELLGFAFSPLGAVVIGISAGLGEELAVRGVLQPRMGLVLSNIFFTSLHAPQYNWDALLIVFIVGMICGVVRNRTNTSTAAIVHGVYNFSLIMLALVTTADG
jgi:membrane protease YdiL (CAAX protease family)